MRLLLLFALFTISSPWLWSQTDTTAGNQPSETPKSYVAPPDISGTWVGELYQDAGGIADKFEFSMQIQQIGRGIKGTTYVKLGEIWAEMDFSGYLLPNGSWKILERGVVRSQKPVQLSWCMKRFILTLDYTATGLALNGPWYGDSEFGPCIPGSIRLRRKGKRV
ncbi:MAG: hypothetical protein AAF597_08110 [Bacteroidota bacterium]